MPITLAPQKNKQPEIAARPENDPQNGLRRWTPDEYHRMIDIDIFDGDQAELRRGEIWEKSLPILYRWNREQYYRMGDAGFFDGERVELLSGGIWRMAPQKTPHFSAIQAAADALEDVFGNQFTVRQQGPLTLPDGTEPEPDLLIVPGSWRDYTEHHPTVAEVRLLVEVSDATLGKDRGSKRADYARAGIREYWIINLIQWELEVHRQPSPDGSYADSRIYQPGESVAPLNAPESPVAVADLLPPARQKP